MDFYFSVHYSTLHQLPPILLHCVGGRWDRTQDCCDALTTRLDLIHENENTKVSVGHLLQAGKEGRQAGRNIGTKTGRRQ